MSKQTKTRPLDPKLKPLWRQALSAWGLGVDLGLPEELLESQDLAYIDLRDRRTRVNLAELKRLNLIGHLVAFFAHEAGHHCRYPQTLVAHTKLLLRQRDLLKELETERPGCARVGKGFDPTHHDQLLNLFLDVLVNDSLAEDYGADFQAIYRRLNAEAPDPRSAAFSFTLACYDALWKIPAADSLVDARGAGVLKGVSPDWRREAAKLARDLRTAPDNNYLRMDLYLEALWPYVVEDAKRHKPPKKQGLTEGLLGVDPDVLSPEQLEEILRRAREEDAADEAREQRRHPALVELPPDDPDETGPSEPPPPSLADLLKAGQGLGQSSQQASQLTRWYYRREAERYRLALDEQEKNEPLVPTTLDVWEAEGDTAAIDWSASLGRMPVAIPGLTLLRREFDSEEAGHRDLDPPWIEIYIDSSGSMPNPSQQFSSLAFAGMLLARSAIRAGSMVRIIQYSTQRKRKAMEEFSADEDAIDDALLAYLGEGTWFPFDLLVESCERFRSSARVLRVVISDMDFFYNTGHEEFLPDVAQVLRQAAAEPNALLAILNLHGQRLDDLPRAAELSATGMELIGIRAWNQLHGVAADIGHRIFGS